jgi:hypothetical protein
MAWQIVDESCNINFKQGGVSVGTYAKELITLEIILAGEPLNDTLVDNVFVLHDGKYGVEIPYNDTTGGYASAEALRAAITTLINTNPCTSGGGGGGGDIKSDGSVNFVAGETWDAGGGFQTYVDPTTITLNGGGGSLEILPTGINIGDGTNLLSLQTDVITGINNTLGRGASFTHQVLSVGNIIGNGATIDDGGFNLIGCTFPSGMTFTAGQNYTNVDFGSAKNVTSITFADTPYTVLGSDHTIFADATGGDIDVTLPNPATNTGNILVLNKTDVSFGQVIIAGVEGLVAGKLDAQYQSIIIQSDGTNWRVTASHLI